MHRHLRVFQAIAVFLFMAAVLSGQSSSAQTRLYLASPYGFSEAGIYFKENVLKPELKRLGFEVIDPWVLTDPKKIPKGPYGIEKKQAWEKLNPEIGRRNQTEIDQSEVVLAILDGTDVDSGTAAEIGYAFAKQKIIVGYRGDFRLASDNEGSVVNLQVEYFVRASGGQIVFKVSELAAVLTRLKK